VVSQLPQLSCYYAEHSQSVKLSLSFNTFDCSSALWKDLLLSHLMYIMFLESVLLKYNFTLFMLLDLILHFTAGIS